MESQNHQSSQMKKIFRLVISKILSDIYCIAALFYTPIELLVIFCRRFRGRLLNSPANDIQGFSQGQLLKMFLKKQIYGTPALLKDRLLKGASLLCTFLLQLISFFTTLSGVSYYFSSIHPLAPLAFAFTIQFLFYILSNSNGQKLVVSFTRKLMLACVFFISITFSYIGIMNQYLPPLKTYESSYQSFYLGYQSVYQEIISNTRQNTIPPIHKIRLLFENAQALALLAEPELTDYENHIKNLNEVSETVRTGRSRWGNTYEVNPSYETAQKEKREYEVKHSQLLAARERLLQNLEALENDTSFEEALNQYMESQQISTGLLEINNSYTQFLDSYKHLLSLIPSAEPSEYADILSLDVLALCDLYLAGNQYTDLKLLSLPEIKKSLGSGLPSTLSNEYLFLLSAKMEEEMNANYDRLMLAAAKTVPGFQPDTLTKLYQSTLPFPDVNLLALEKLRPSSLYFKQGLTALFLALLVDGMTILIPSFTSLRSRNPLVFRRRKTRLHTEQEVMEVILLSLIGYGDISSTTASEGTLQAAVTFDSPPFKMPNTRLPFTDYSPWQLSRCLEVLKEYRTIYESSPWTNRQGYSKYLARKKLEEKHSLVFCHLTDVLCSLNFLTVVTEKEYQHLVQKAQNTKLPYPELSSQNPGDTIYLMRKGFDLWISEQLPLYKTMYRNASPL